jgi:D-sedoheptulose 7-phosphate isomerase
MKKNLNFIKNYINSFSKEVTNTEKLIPELTKFINILKGYNKKNNLVHIFGNGGSAAIASHFSLDLTNNTNIKCCSYNDASLITCFANDFGYENWVAKSISKYANKDDLLILISASGKSQNMINAVKEARRKKINRIITLTGFEKNNPLKKIGNINLWINSKQYNVIENIHQFWLLLVVDFLKKN